MQFKKITPIEHYAIRLVKGEEVMVTLTDFSRKHNIQFASFYGIGAFTECQIAYYYKGKYRALDWIEEAEVLNISGNVALLKGEPFIHTHVVLGTQQEYEAVGGHLNEAIVYATAEIFMTVYDVAVERKFDQDIKINLLNLDK